jgi:hypothetical protein
MHKKSRIQSAIALLIGAALLVPVVSIAQAQTPSPGNESSIDDQDVARVARKVCGLKYKRVTPLRKGYLQQGAQIISPYSLTRNKNYCFVALGNEDALDVDLELLDRAVKSLSPAVADRTDDEIAFATFTPRQNGRHHGQVEMYECQAERCEYALGVYRR